VRINLIDPVKLCDQHLIAEYNEILMLLGYIKKYPGLDNLPKSYVLGKGHMRFFKDKLDYINKRHKTIKAEMKKRGFQTNKGVDLSGFDPNSHGDWNPKTKDYKKIKARLIEKIKLKPDYYRYYGEKRSQEFFINQIKNG
jgi:deoxyribonuclease (pyrimidine dimer)